MSAILETDMQFLSDFLSENYPKSAEKHPASLDFGGVFVPGFDGFSYSLKTAMLNDTVRVSLNHPIQRTPLFTPKTGGKNGKPPMGIAKPSIFDSKKTGISESSSSAEGPL